MLHDSQVKKEDLQVDRVGSLKSRLEALKQLLFTARQRGDDERAKLRNVHAEQVDLLSHTLAAKEHTLVDKNEELKRAIADLEDQIGEAKKDLANAKLATQHSRTEVEARIVQELTAQTSLAVRALEDRVKHLETTKDQLNTRNGELGEEIKQLERNSAAVSVKCDKENGLLRQELQNCLKDQNSLAAKCDKLERDLAVVNSVLEVLYYYSAARRSRTQNLDRRTEPKQTD